MRRKVVLCLLLAAITLTAYWPVRHAEFTNFDDPVYVTNNENVFHGLTSHGFVWAFTTIHGSNWHPLTWLSHMLDCQLFGDNAAKHHLMNVGLHIANSMLVFLLFCQMTGAVWRSAFVAALFALHPLHVESVAWISERKDVLSTFFGLLTLLAYVGYVQTKAARKPDVSSARQWIFYSLAVLAFILGLLSKPMLVTLPFAMLLLDFWPLSRLKDWRFQTDERLVVEKLPFFLLAAASSVVTYRAQKLGGAMISAQSLPTTTRLANVFLSYARYLGKTFWPANLAAYYPFKNEILLSDAVLAGLLFLGLTALAIFLIRRAPYVTMGWFWFVGTLVPVIGLVQVGAQTMADRYTYIPLVGVFAAITWAIAELTAKRRWQTPVLSAFAAVVLAACTWRTQYQAATWQNSVALFSHAVEVTGDNAFAEHNLGHALSHIGKQKEAIEHFDRSLRLSPGFPPAYFNRATAYGLLGFTDKAVDEYRQAIHFKRDYEQAYSFLGKALALEGKLDEARTNFLLAIHYKPDYFEAHTKLGNVLILEGDINGAMDHLRAAVKIQPDYDEGQYYLGAALVRKQEFAEAAQHLRAAVKLNPNYSSALNDLGWLLATCPDAKVRNPADAVRFATHACELTGNEDPAYLDTLAVAKSEAGDLKSAIDLTQKAIKFSTQAGDAAMAAQLELHLASYRAGHTYTQGESTDSAPNPK